MSDKLDALKGFTPASSLDTGAMLYEAGRASVPSAWRAWALVALLSLTQAITLLALVPTTRTSPPGADAPGSPAGEPKYEPRPMHVRHLPDEPPAGDVPPDRPALRVLDISSFD